MIFITNPKERIYNNLHPKGLLNMIQGQRLNIFL